MTAVPSELTNNEVEFDLSRLEISEATARFDMPWVSDGAFLLVRPATPENEKYSAASLRMGGRRQRGVVAAGSLSASAVDDDREEDRVLYPKYVIVGWGKILDSHREPAEFTPENCRAFVKALPLWIFDKLRLFCMRPERFLDEGDADEAMPDPVGVAGN